MTVAERLRASEVSQRLAAIAEVTEQGAAGPEILTALGECLGDARKAVQRQAAEALAVLARQGVPVEPTLLAALTAAEVGRRWGAAYALSLIGPPPPAALPVLLEVLGANDGDLRWASAHIIGRVEPRGRVAEPLRALVRTGSALARKMALYCLRDLGPEAGDVQALVADAVADTDPGVRLAAMAALVRLATNRPAAATHLVGCLGDPDEGVRRAAAASLGRLGERSAEVMTALRAAARSPDRALARAAEHALAALDARRID